MQGGQRGVADQVLAERQSGDQALLVEGRLHAEEAHVGDPGEQGLELVVGHGAGRPLMAKAACTVATGSCSSWKAEARTKAMERVTR